MKLKDGFTGERALVLPSSVLQIAENDPLGKALYITDIGYYPRAEHHYRQRIEPISQYVLIYCLEGKGWFSVGHPETSSITHTVSAGECFVLPAGESHSYGADNDNPWTIYWIHFKGTLASQYAARLIRPLHIDTSLCSRIRGRLTLFEEIFHSLSSGPGRDNILYACSAFHHFLGTLCFLQEYRSADKETAQNDDMVKAAIHYMHENIEKRLTVSDMAHFTGYSVSRFSSLFSAHTGHSPVSYFNLLKIQHACLLLDHSNIRINQVCYKIGIDDCYYFSRLFTKIMGMPPSAYKHRKKG